jgi:hypothetical protein
MIIKFYDHGRNEFRVIDHCEDVGYGVVDTKDCIKRYDDLYPDKSGYDPAAEGVVENSAVLAANKVFVMTTSAYYAEHNICVIDEFQPLELTKRIGYTRIGVEGAIVSNMALYLMNDDGKTIERII